LAKGFKKVDQIFKDIDEVCKALDRAKILEKEFALKAKDIVDSCTTQLGLISQELALVIKPKGKSLKNATAGF